MSQKAPGALRKLAGETAIYGMSTILARFINFLFVPLYTYILSTTDYGILTEFMAYIALLQVALLLGLETGCFRFANREGNDPNTVFSNAYLAVSAVSLVALLLLGSFSETLSFRMGYGDSQICYWLIGLILAMDSTTAILFAKLRFESKAWRFAGIKTLKILTETGTNLLLFLVFPSFAAEHPDHFLLTFLPATPNFVYPIFAIFVSCIVAFLLLIPELLRLNFRPDKGIITAMLRYSLPLMLAALPGIVNDFLDRILFRFFHVDQTLWQSDLGIYQAAVKLAVIMSLFVQMFRYAAEPFFFSRAKDRNSPQLYAKVMEYFVAFCLLIFLGVTLYIDLFQLLLGRDFRAGMGIVPIMLLSYLMLGMLYNVSMWYKLSDRSSYAIWITLAGLVVSAVINILFLPKYSYWAAAWGHFASYGAMLVISTLLGNKYYPIPYRWGRILSIVALALGLFAISCFLPELALIPKLIVHTVLILLYLVIYYFGYEHKNRKQISL